MRRVCVSLFLSLFLAAPAIPAGLAQQPPAKAKQAKKVWTNDELDELQGKGRVSVVGQAPAAAPAGAQPAAADADKAAAKPAEYVREKDAKWYRDQLSKLRAELDTIDSEIRRLREFRSSAKGAMGGIVLGQEGASLTPENQIQQLEKRKRDVQRQIADLEDQARRNDISPGALR